MGKRMHRPSDHNIEEPHIMTSSYILKREESAPIINLARYKEDE